LAAETLPADARGRHLGPSVVPRSVYGCWARSRSRYLCRQPACDTAVTTTIRLRLDRSSIALFDDLRYDRRPTCCELLHCGLNKL